MNAVFETVTSICHQSADTADEGPAGGTARKRILNQRLGLDRSTAALRTSLRLPQDLPLQVWLRIGDQLRVVANSCAWWAGDWLVYGQDAYPDRYRQAVATTSLDYQTLRNYAWVARKFQVSRRRDRLSFQHHQEVAALPEDQQELWLDRATEFGWSKTELRRQLRAATKKQADSLGPSAQIQFDLTQDQLERWRLAAEHQGSDLIRWLVCVIDQVASRIIDDQPGEARSLAAADIL